MKDILIIADGIVAKHFLERVCGDTDSDNSYSVVYYNDKTITDKKADHIKYFKFDPTSFSKLRSVFKDSIVEVFIVVKKRFDALETYKNIRTLSKEIHIVLLDVWHLSFEDTNLSLLSANEVLSSRLFDFLPNVSVVAQNVGLGIGEIMEIDVPFGSPYVYRHISSIKQKNWRISAIYRANDLILPKPSTMIYPNDILLVIGDPNILRSVNISIKQEFGSFPSPYGKNIYVLIDMQKNNPDEIEKMINNAFLLHSKLNNNKLIIKVINPTYSKCYDKIKSYDKGSVRVFIDYETDNFKNALFKDLEIFSIGLIIVEQRIFENYKKMLYDAKIPVFKTGMYDFSKVKQSIIIPEDSTKIEKLTAPIFDISAQLDLDIELYDYDPEEMDINDELIDHFKNLGSMFKRKIKVVKPKHNPIVELETREDIVQFLPFDKSVKNEGLLPWFSKSFQKLYYKLSGAYQIFIPVPE
jgi:hypothetical protein